MSANIDFKDPTERLIIYQRALLDWQTNNRKDDFCEQGFCYYFERTVFGFHSLGRNLPELYRQEPLEIEFGSLFWFPTDEAGKRSRIECLNDAINLIKKIYNLK